VKRFFDFMADKQRVFENPFAGLEPIHHGRKLMPVPSEQDMQALLATPDAATERGLRTRSILEVAYSTGARLEELARMKLGDLDPANGTVRIMGKGNRERVAPLGTAAMEWVKRYVLEARSRQANGDATALWVKAGGTGLGGQGISRSIQECARQAGVTITPHGIRRACATHMLRRGAHPVQLQTLLGHASLKHLSQYLRVSFREMRAMHEGSRLGR
jgi:integrase/recombinase XerD